MPNNLIRCCILGGQEKDLYALGELHKQQGVEIAFVYDKDPDAVGLEIAEILGISKLSDPEDFALIGEVDYVVVTEPRAAFEHELALLSGGGAKIVSQSEAISMFGPKTSKTKSKDVTVEAPDVYSVEDALKAFEQLFDKKKLLRLLLDVAVQAARATAGSIMLYSSEARELYIAYATGLSERVVRNTRQKLGEGIAGSVAKRRKGRLIRESADKTLYPSDRDRPDIRSAISVPLEWESRLLGVLNVSSDLEERELAEDGLNVLQRLSGRISRVLHESIKFQATQIRHRELNLRQSMGELAAKSISTQAKFSLISNLLGELVDADTVEVFVGTHEGDWLVLGGSNRRFTSEPEMVRCERGALARAFLERRSIVLTESVESHGEPSALVSSFAFVPVALKEVLGVLMMEFSDPQKMEEFLVIKDSVTLELSRFIASEKREKNLRHELDSLAKVSDSAPILLTCHTLDDLCDFTARLVANVLEADRVSVRIQDNKERAGKLARYESTPTRGNAWSEEDDERFLKLKKAGVPFSLAFLNFAPEAGDKTPPYHSVIAAPITVEKEFRGGIIAYDKRPRNPLEDATFTEVDRAIIQHVVSIVEPAIRAIQKSGRVLATETPSEPITYDEMLRGNFIRLKKVMEGEMSRSDRYHHAFSLLLLKISPLGQMFVDDENKAIALVDEITRGIQTRTRKTDYGSWIRRDTFAMVSLEGSRRIRFLIGRLMLYLLKDFASVTEVAIAPSDVLVAHSFYPGSARTPEAMLEEVENNMVPYRQDDDQNDQ